MIDIRPVKQFDNLLPVMSLLRQLAIFEKMEDDFSPDTDRLRVQLSHNANPQLHIKLAYDSVTPVGVVIYYIGDYTSFRSRWRVYLEDVFVKESHRGRGVLRKLLKPVAELAVDRRIEEIAFAALVWNQNAIAAYKHLGAVETGDKVDERGDRWRTMAFRGRALVALAA